MRLYVASTDGSFFAKCDSTLIHLRGRFDVESLLVAIERAACSYPLAR